MVWFVGAAVTFAASDDDLVPNDADVRTILPADRHLTVVFLGATEDSTARAGWEAIPELSFPAEARALRWERLGRSALALELADDGGALAAAAVVAAKAVTPFVAVSTPTPFRPHVTMARVPRRATPPTAAVLQVWPLPANPLRIEPLALFRSAPPSTDRRYEVVDQR